MTRIDRIAEGWCAGNTGPVRRALLELEGSERRTVLPLARQGAGRSAVQGEGPLAPGDLAAEAGVRPQL
jgi:hypothetical protein